VAIITGAQLKDYAHNDVTLLDDAYYTLAATGAEEWINDYCQRSFPVASASSARSYAPVDGSGVLFIHDCTTITSVVDNSVTLTLDTDYQKEPLTVAADGTAVPYYRLRRLSSYWYNSTPGKATVVVTATWGWTAVPSRVTEAAYIIGKDILMQRNISNGVAGFDGFGAVRVRTNPIAMQLLDGLRHPAAFGFA
jgi:hypothetical protein